MLVVMQSGAAEEQVRVVCRRIESLGYQAQVIGGAQRTAVAVTGNHGELEPAAFDGLPGVQEVVRITRPFLLAGRESRSDNTVVAFANSDATIGGKGLAVMAGPCAIESREQALAIAERVKAAGAQFFRGGA